MRELLSKGGKEIQVAKQEIFLSRLISEGLEEEDFLVLADELSRDNTIEPLEQIYRATQGHLDAIMNVRLIMSDSKTWELCGLRKTESRKPWEGIIDYHDRSSKSRSNEFADSMSLSMMQWIADNSLIENQKLAFITADRGVSEWYDEWFHRGKESHEYAPTNYIVRNFSQYLPQINLRNSKNTVSDNEFDKSGNTFEKIRQVVELIIAPDMMKKLNKKTKIFTFDDFSNYEKESINKESLPDEIESILSDLAQTEKRSLYFFDDYLKKRIPSSLLKNVSTLNSKERAIAIRNYLIKRMDQHKKSSIDYCISGISTIDISRWSRVPRTLHFPIRSNNDYLCQFIDESIREKKIDVDAVKELPSYKIFAICSGLFHAKHHEQHALQHANRYAQLCLSDCESAPAEERDILVAEASFLCAQINRFLIGHCSRIKPAEEYYEAAVRFLERIARDQISNEIDAARYDSELGAVHLFMAAQYYIACDNEKGNELISEAEKILSKCVKNGLYAGGSGKISEVQRHYSHNLAAIQVIRSFNISYYDSTFHVDGLRESVMAILENTTEKEKPSPFLHAELYFFLSLDDDSYIDKAKEYIDKYYSENDPGLIVDNWQIFKMRKKLSEAD